MIAARLLVRGRVQGVFFRDWTRGARAAAGVAGWVRNRPDGTVEVHAEGEAAAVESLRRACHARAAGGAGGGGRGERGGRGPRATRADARLCFEQVRAARTAVARRARLDSLDAARTKRQGAIGPVLFYTGAMSDGRQ